MWYKELRTKVMFDGKVGDVKGLSTTLLANSGGLMSNAWMTRYPSGDLARSEFEGEAQALTAVEARLALQVRLHLPDSQAQAIKERGGVTYCTQCSTVQRVHECW